MVMIVCAMKLEAKPFLRALDNKRIKKHGELRVYHGRIAGVDVMVACCGVGMRRAAANIQSLIDSVGPSQIVMSGTAGGIDAKLKIGDTVVSDELIYHEIVGDLPIQDGLSMDGLPFKADAALLECASKAIKEKPPEHSVYFGRISTGKSFVRGEAFDYIISKCNPLCTDMESAAVAHVCQINSVPFIAVRSMSDTREVSGLSNFFKYASLASKNSFIVVRALLAALPEQQDSAASS